jgi:DNA-directed RNA polymerase subunit RPC12/RpoP
MDNCVYMTNRYLGEKGMVKCWVYKKKCTQCTKSVMGKPKDEKTGNVKIRAKEYVCPSCHYSVEKKAYEETLTAEMKYTCPKCEHQGNHSMPFKRKKIKIVTEAGKEKKVDALQFSCAHCGEKINVTKKLK